MRETLKKYSPKPENINLGWFNKHLTNPEIWKWNKKTISRAFAIGLFFCIYSTSNAYFTCGNFRSIFFRKHSSLSPCGLD